MEKTTKEKILEYLKTKDTATINELANFLTISHQTIHLHLKNLLEKNLIIKRGVAPKVFYSINKELPAKETKISIPEETAKIIEENFLLIEPNGSKKLGIPAFVIWCEKRNFNVEQKAQEYIDLYRKYNKLKQQGLLDGKQKMKNSFKAVCLDDIFYIDFYAWEIFGKTKLGQLLLYAKQSQDKKIMNELIDTVKPQIIVLLQRENIEAIGFIPPTVKRETQFMKVLEKRLNLNLPTLSIVKIKTEITVPQKTLSKIEDRIENAETSIIVDEKRRGFKKILLVDDAVGSGATLNSVACKIKKNGIADSVIGLAITGSLKGFDIISEI